jgi:hypothetical protein
VYIYYWDNTDRIESDSNGFDQKVRFNFIFYNFKSFSGRKPKIISLEYLFTTFSHKMF